LFKLLKYVSSIKDDVAMAFLCSFSEHKAKQSIK